MHGIADQGVRYDAAVTQTAREHRDPDGSSEPSDLGGDESPEGVFVGRAVAAYEERMHAVHAGLAAVSAAAHVLTTQAAVTGPTMRLQLGTLMIEELERLQRLASTGDPIPIGEQDTLDLDEILESVVLARHLVDHEVDWVRSGRYIQGSRDAVVELLNILLVNAERHAPGAPVRIVVEPDGGMVKVSVIDGGPGVSEELAQVVFDRGAHRNGSTGQGIGLAMARDLAAGLGGTLELDRAARPGAQFDLTLPAADLGGGA